MQKNLARVTMGFAVRVQRDIESQGGPKAPNAQKENHMPVTFTAEPTHKQRKKAAQDRRRAERAQEQARRAEWQRRQEEHTRRWWDEQRHSFRSFSGGSTIPTEDKEMARALVDAGYRALSRKFHPDMGGSHEQMVLINRALEALRKVVS